MGKFKKVVLGLLAEGERSSYELFEKLTAEGYWFVQARLYPTLRWFERQGFVTVRQGDPLPERGGRPRYYYTLTEEGQKAHG